MPTCPSRPCRPSPLRAAVAALLGTALLLPLGALAAPAASAAGTRALLPAAGLPPDALGAAGALLYTQGVLGDEQAGGSLRLKALGGTSDVELVAAQPGVDIGESVLSPDGSTVAYTALQAGAPTAETLYVLPVDGSAPPRALLSADLLVSLSWTPDSLGLVLERFSFGPDIPYHVAMQRIPAAGGTPVDLPYAGERPQVSRTGQLAFLAPPDLELSTAPLSGGVAPRRLGVRGESAAWSPDGSQLAWVSGDTSPGGRSDLHVVRADGTGDRTLTIADEGRTVPPAHPQWLPDGQGLVYSRLSYGVTDRVDLYRVDLAGSRTARVLPPADDPTLSQRSPSVAFPLPADVTGVGAASRFVPLAPSRVLDTRRGLGGATRLGPGGTADLVLPGAAAAGVTAAVLNVTAVAPSAGTVVGVSPTGSPAPAASSLNPAAGQNTAALVTARVGVGGAVTLRNDRGDVDLVVDLTGWYVPADTAPPTATGFTAVPQTRLYDSRPGHLPEDGPKTRLAAGSPVDLVVTGHDGVPTDAGAVVITVTGVDPDADTALTVVPAGAAAVTSTVNLRPHQDVANAAVVPVGDGGAVRLVAAGGAADVVVDVTGYYSASSPGRFVPVAPTRFLDTRNGLGGALAPLTTSLDLKVTGSRGVPAGAVAVVGSLTAVAPSAGTVLRAFPAGSPPPAVSALNVGVGEVRAAPAYLLPDAAGAVRVTNDRGQLDLVADVSGWFE